MKLLYSPNFLALLAIFILSVFALKDLLKPGLYTSHDGETHTARIAQYYLAVKDGQLPPRYAGTFYNGLGSPIFVYIYPIPYLIGSIFHFIGFTFVDSFKLLMALGFVMSGVFCYLWLLEVFKSPKAAFLGSLFYIWSPYRFLLIYVRGSISENTAYIFLPLVLLTITKFNVKKNLIWLSLSAISFALLLLSQNLVALMSVPLILAYVVLTSLASRVSIKTFLAQITALVLGLAMSAFTYIPSFFERGFVKFDEIIGPAYGSHFATLKQILYSPWGYGFDLPGTVNDSLSLQVGLAHWMGLLISVLLFLLLILNRYKVFSAINNYLFETPDKPSKFLYILFLSTVMVTIFLIVESAPNAFIWRNVKSLSIIDIPWRLLGITSIALAFCISFFAKNTRSGLVFLFLVVAVLVANRNHLRVNKNILYEDEHFLNYYGHATYYSEFSPVWRDHSSVPEKISPKIKYKTINGNVDVEVKSANSNKLNMELNVKSETADVRINKSYFPGMSVRDNGMKLENFTQVRIPKSSDIKEGDDPDNVGLPILILEKGRHTVDVIFGETPLRKAADYLSLFAFLTAVIFLLKFRNVKIS